MAKNKKKSSEQKAAKAEKQLKKANKKSGKNNDDNDFDDLEKMLQDFKKQDEKLMTVSETEVNQPSVRSSATLTASPVSDELYLFGGEHNTGNKTFVYNDFFCYNTKKLGWSKLFIPNPPPPRCGHQAVISPANGGELWVFGGEFSSPSGNQFYHYKDLWVLNLKNKSKWEQIPVKNMKNCPSARSGHRMVYNSLDKKIYIFGGFNERMTEFIYYNDLYSFSIIDRSWSKISPVNQNLAGPSPRSACQFVSLSSGLAVFGGYCKKRGKKKDQELGNVLWDGHFYSPEKNCWTPIRQSGSVPDSRSSFAFSQTYTVKEKQRLFFFGGVADEEADDDLESEFYNDIHIIDVSNQDKFRWFPGVVRGVEEFEPCPRMSSLVALKDSTIYLFGGLFEDNTAQVTLNDFWSLDLKKMNGWKQLNSSDDIGGQWDDLEADEDDEKDEVDDGADDDEMEQDGDDDEDDDDDKVNSENDEMEVSKSKSKSKSKSSSKPLRKIKKQDKSNWKFGRAVSSIFDSHPNAILDEDFSIYYNRTVKYWEDLMQDAADAMEGFTEDGEEMTREVVEVAAKDMAKAYYRRCQKV